MGAMPVGAWSVAHPVWSAQALNVRLSNLFLSDYSTERMHEGWLGRASSEPWNFYLTHQLKRTYVDTLGGRRFGAPYIFNVWTYLHMGSFDTEVYIYICIYGSI